MRRLLSLTLLVCTVTFAAFAAQGQRAGIAVTGHVVDPSGAPLGGATVRITGTGFTTRTAVTDARGRFRFGNIPPASYQIEVALAGFGARRQPLTVSPDGAGEVAITLTLRPIPATRQGSLVVERGDLVKHAGAAPAAISPLAMSSPGAPPPAGVWVDPARPRFNTEAYERIDDNPFRSTRVDPLSTFSIDVDTASYANVRRFLSTGALPPPDAVRIEEMINYFRFDYPQPARGAPFSVTSDVGVAPWNPKHRLVLIGLQARQLEQDRALRRNLVFLIDVSGSMMPDDKLPLIRTAMRMLVDSLTAHDRIAIVVYAGASGLVLPTTAGDQKDRIQQAIARLEAGGATNGGAGIRLAYKIAQEQFIREGINRVILATDGDFNVGTTNQGELTRLIEEQREGGVFLSVLGVGTGNLKDSTMEKLADKGNGNYSYLDSLHEARKVLVSEAGGTLVAVAKDVKIQVEFNPAHVAAYRLIGYENRVLRHEDFNNDRKDAGEIGAGHTVTALYEIVPPSAAMDLPGIDPLKYQATPVSPGSKPPSSGAHADELMTVKLRYKQPDGDVSKLLSFAVANRATTVSDNLGFAAAIAEFGMVLRRSEHKGAATYRSAAALARRHRGSDEHGYRSEAIRLIELAETLTRQTGDEASSRHR